MTQKSLDKILIFEPQYKTVIWGGNRISQLKGEHLTQNNIGESWEISSIEGYESVVAEGPLKGMSISELSEQFGADFLGTDVVSRYGNKFPLLIKLLDAHDILSLQVHPNDAVAERYHNSHGKSEMWYVIDAKNDARIYCGLAETLSPESFDRHVNDKSIMDMVATYQSRPGQFYFIPAGTIHSIGAGNLIAEIQQSSDITYRVYDHDRTTSDGKPRELHLEQARAAIDYSHPTLVEPTAKCFADSTRSVVSTEHFTVDYYKVDGKAEIDCSEGSFTALLVTNGTADICADGQLRTVNAGHTVLIPASVKKITATGSAILLATHL
ncbi:MAG: class I mannose-6-phosphate isomerase [Muribaculaceae bacterium]|nr:class I mannose-6-phosphate isomerase [Muribaculaceae bacterium]MDE5594970.1 class I mannose-6-phosphate isomerase [Muribaculaceae bacterium]MDE6702257.1 class I mannose-6-phosphate isomerase [Muribaculaceae bacterium]